MPSGPTTCLDLGDPAFLADPYPMLAAERARLGAQGHEMAWHEAGGRWLTFTHGAASRVLRERSLQRTWHDREPAARLEPFNLLHRHQMMENEPPEHTRLRRAVATAFNKGHVERLRPRVRELAAGLLAEIDQPRFDVIGRYAEPLPVLVIAELLGAPASAADQLRAWSQAIVRMYEPDPDDAVTDAAVAAAEEFAGFVAELVLARRARPAADLISDLVGSGLSQAELVASVVLLLNAGHEASVNVFGNGLGPLLAAGGPSAGLQAACEEMLRFDSALQLFERTATEPLTIGSVTIEPGQRVAALLGAANRDPAVFADADVFDAGRDPNPHLAFSAGIHFCLGAPLARMELAESLEVLLAWHPGLFVESVSARGTFVLRGNSAVMVRTDSDRERKRA